MTDVITQRAVGALPLSIATSLAIEAALGVHPDHPTPKAPILTYGALWINIRTLFRNLIGALPTTVASQVGPKQCMDALAGEMDTIAQVIKDRAPAVQVVFYVSNYEDVGRHRHIAVRMDTTPRQKEYTALFDETMRLLLKDPHAQPIVGFRDGLQPKDRDKTLILTNYAYDLLSAKRFGSLDLLESHTGIIKPPNQWYTKFYNGKELPMIPFTDYFLRIFGDAQTYRPMDIKLRNAIVEVANKYKWSPLTTRDKVVYSLQQMPDRYQASIVRDLM